MPDNTAVRTALWRALHVELDAPPQVLDDQLGLALAAPDEGWRARGDMHPIGTRTFRASIVARARFVEDLVAAGGVDQYVLLGAGLDTFAQRRAELASKLQVHEVDQPETQAWKRSRLRELGFDEPAWLHFVPVDFERQSWWDELAPARHARARLDVRDVVPAADRAARSRRPSGARDGDARRGRRRHAVRQL